MSKTDWQLRQDLCTTENNYYRIVPRYVVLCGGIDLEVEVYVGIKKTPKGMWIIRKDWIDYVDKKWVKKRFILDQKWVKKRFILDSSKKKYAYPTIQGAVNNFIERKIRQLSILERRLNDTKYQLELAENMKNKGI